MIKLIVGLGNPGLKYEDTRHNAGVWMLQQIARQYNGSLRSEMKFHGEACQVSILNQDVRLLFPTTFMNLSGQAVAALTDYFKINIDEILVLHDELDINPGALRLKKGGGHGGHNGLRDIIQHLGKDFLRLRIGIGHPGDRTQVTNFVLKSPSQKERDEIDQAIDNALKAIPEIISGKHQKVMNQLHQKPKKELKQKPVQSDPEKHTTPKTKDPTGASTKDEP